MRRTQDARAWKWCVLPLLTSMSFIRMINVQVGHMVNAALYILKTPCIWSMVPQGTSGPTPFSDTTTYLDRAKAYVAAADQCVRLALLARTFVDGQHRTVDSYYIPWFFTSSGLLIQPNDTRCGCMLRADENSSLIFAQVERC